MTAGGVGFHLLIRHENHDDHTLAIYNPLRMVLRDPIDRIQPILIISRPMLGLMARMTKSYAINAPFWTTALEPSYSETGVSMTGMEM